MNPPPGPAPLSFLGSVALPTALLVRRRYPLAAVGAFLVASVLVNLERPLSDSGDSIAAGVGVLVMSYSLGAHAAGWRALVGLALTLGLVFVAVVTDPDEATADSYIFFGIVVGGPWAAGRAIRHRRLSEASLSDRAERLVEERDRRAAEAVAQERDRIARELHDVVAHAISVIGLQARGGRKVIASDAARATRAFDAIEETAGQALTEMRRLLGMLRMPDEKLAREPQPSLARLDELVAQVRGAGLPVEIDVQGEPVELPPGIDLSAYRIVQEALTNAIKHAGPTRARVLVTYRPEDIQVEVTDDGAGSAAIAEDVGSGHGLAGMRERVAVFGGELDAGREPTGGFTVRARLPLR
jgi:signal transduction histidine kinase